VAALAFAVAGCATVPTSGPVEPARGGTGQPQLYPQLIAVRPQPKWGPEDIVLGFLHASATFTNDHAVAREYLTPAQSRKWHPGWAATVVAGQPTLHSQVPLRNIVGGAPGSKTDTITLTGQHLATLSDSGQYKSSQGASVYRFTLVRNGGVWRISQLPGPSSLLLLTKPDFVNVYQPRNLYFFTTSGRWLVPDPVFVPQQTTNTVLATGLVTALLAKRQGWLTGATSTRFPAGTTLLGGQVKINGSNAIVNLGGAAAKANNAVRQQMAAQLVSTLASSAYTPSAIQSVQMQINGVAQTAGLNGVPTAYSWRLPVQSRSQPYFLGGDEVSVLHGGSSRVVANLARPLSLIAISPGSGQVAGIATAGKKAAAVYSGPLTRSGQLVRRQYDGGSCTSLSWDNNNEIFAAAGQYVWMFPPHDGAAVPVLPSNLSSSQTVTDLRVAPDGVRVAMIVRGGNGTYAMEIGAISRNGAQLQINPKTVVVGAGISDPAQLAWYGEYNILVLAQRGPQARLYEVPVNGGAPTQIQAVHDAVSISSNGTDLVLGTGQGRIWVSDGPNAQWRPAAAGQAPVYPG
jgi:hypothetical protein